MRCKVQTLAPPLTHVAGCPSGRVGWCGILPCDKFSLVNFKKIVFVHGHFNKKFNNFLLDIVSLNMTESTNKSTILCLGWSGHTFSSSAKIVFIWILVQFYLFLNATYIPKTYYLFGFFSNFFPYLIFSKYWCQFCNSKSKGG